METFDPVLNRRRTLTNSAAEFVEGRGGLATLHQLLDTPEDIEEFYDDTEFVPEFDRFAPKGIKLNAAILYSKSQSSMETFRDVTMRRLVTTLKNGRVEERLGVTLKDPSEFDVEYILGIVGKLKDAKDAPNTKSCKNFIRSCYRKVEDNRGVIGEILEMVPSDIYGSVLSGGFSLILTAIEHHAEQREAMRNFLAAIPEKLETIQRLASIHHASIRLHACMDAVMTAVFAVLESIVEKITRTFKVRVKESTERWSRKLSRLSGRTENLVADASVVDAQTANSMTENDLQQPTLDVSNALSAFQTQVDCFQKEVDMCGHERLGEINNNTNDIMRGQRGLFYAIERNAREVQSLKVWLRSLASEGRDFSEKSLQSLSVDIKDTLYRVCASDPDFDSKTGGANLRTARLITYQREAETPVTYQETNERITASWLKGLKDFSYDANPDMLDLFEHLEVLTHDEKNVSNSVIRSEQVGNWLKARGSRVLNIEPETSVESLTNPTSFSTALLVTTLRLPARYPVLAFFCMHRNNDDCSDEKSGPIALVKSLNAQLLTFVAEYRPEVDLSRIKDWEFFRKAKKSLKDSLQMLDALVRLLPDDDKVFIVIDSLSRLSGSTKDEDRVIKRLGRFVKKEQGPVVKILITATLSDSRFRKIADESLFVQDSASGFGTINVDVMEDEILKSVDTPLKSDQSASGDSSDTDSD